MKQRVLIVEDSADFSRILRDNLILEGFDVQCVNDGALALSTAREFSPDLILLDVMLPGKTGFELCALLRQGRRTPIIFLTVRGQTADKLRGLNLGADDYITKPLDLKELIARIRAVLRRARPQLESLTLGNVIVDFVSLQAWKGSDRIALSHREFDLLRYLAERPDSIVYRNELLKEVWGYQDTPNTRSVDHAIARLRRKIEPDAHHPVFVHSSYGDGYCLTPNPSKLPKG